MQCSDSSPGLVIGGVSSGEGGGDAVYARPFVPPQTTCPVISYADEYGEREEGTMAQETFTYDHDRAVVYPLHQCRPMGIETRGPGSSRNLETTEWRR